MKRRRKRAKWVTKAQFREAVRILDATISDRQFERMWAEGLMNARTGGQFQVIEGGRCTQPSK